MIRQDAMKKSHGRHISMRLQNGRADYLGSSDGMSQADGIGLVFVKTICTSIIQNVNTCIYFQFSKIIDTNYVLG